MQHLLNILEGVGQALNALGTSPQYRYPEVGDRVRDQHRIAGDMMIVGRRLRKNVKKEQDRVRDGEVKDCSTA